MKRTLLPLSLAMLLGASMQAQTTGVVLAPGQYFTDTTPIALNQTYSGSQAMYTADQLASATDNCEAFTISELIYTLYGSTAPSSYAGEVTLYYLTTENTLSSPAPARIMKTAFNGEITEADFEGNQLHIKLTEPIEMRANENLVVGLSTHTTNPTAMQWRVNESQYSWFWAKNNTSEVDFTTTPDSNSYFDIPALSIVYTEGEGGETPVENAFEAEITNASAVRISATEAEVAVTYNVTKQENVVGYKFEVVDAAGSVLGSSEVKAGVRGEETIELTLPEGNNDAIEAVVKMNAVYTDDTASDPITYNVTVPEYIDNPNGVDIVSADNGEAVYYNLQGVRVANPENGLYIRVQNGKAQKVTVK